MSSQQRTIMGALDYSIASLQNIKSALVDHGNPQKQVNWAIGGIMATITANLLKLSQDVFLESIKNEEANAQDDIKAIQSKFNEFMQRMIDNG
jgi:hypothetical protein